MTAIEYLHHTPGRLRVKGRNLHCRAQSARRAVTTLQSIPGVELVRLNRHSGSLTIKYNPNQLTQDDLINALEITGCLQSKTARIKPNASEANKDKVTGVFGKALVSALAQRTAGHLIGKLL